MPDAIRVSTVTGAITPAQLGRTLMHEHLTAGYPGFESHTTAAGPKRAERVAICVGKIGEMQGAGFTAMLDPCPNDLGRDVELMAEVAQRARFQLICATGLYKQSEGGYPYWRFRSLAGPDGAVNAMAELFEKELTEGVGETGIRAGVIKVATGKGEMTGYEKQIFKAAAKASAATGAPITTHTDAGTVGDVQQQVLAEAGAAPHQIIIGHSCASTDLAYHLRIAAGGSYLGFDRFGLEPIHPDEKRIAALLAVLKAGAGDRVVVSHDSVWCWGGAPFPDMSFVDELARTNHPLHLSRVIVPKLRAGGATEAQLDALFVENPRRYFAREPLPPFTPNA